MNEKSTTILWGSGFDGEASLGEFLKVELHDVPAIQTMDAKTVNPADFGEVL